MYRSNGSCTGEMQLFTKVQALLEFQCKFWGVYANKKILTIYLERN